jgi:hypothetical protein
MAKKAKATAAKPTAKKAASEKQAKRASGTKEARSGGRPAKTATTTGDLVVFAMRVPRSERDAIHAAAGPAKASSWVRRLTAAAASLDTETIAELIEETRERLTYTSSRRTGSLRSSSRRAVSESVSPTIGVEELLPRQRSSVGRP